MSFPITPTIERAAAEAIKSNEADGRVLNVYRVAQNIQDEHPSENVALEDIVGLIVMKAGGLTIGLEFDSSLARSGAVIEIVTQDDEASRLP